MNSETVLSLVAAVFAVLLAVAGLWWKRNSLASWCFGLGMIALAADAVVSGIAVSIVQLDRLGELRNVGLWVRSGLTALWLCFSVVYSRGHARDSFRRWSAVISFSFLAPAAAMLVFQNRLIKVLIRPDSNGIWLQFGPAAKFVNLVLLIGTVLVLMNLERTFRAAVGTMQWRIKFLILGLAVIFGVRVYTGSQGLVFSGHGNTLPQLESIALLIGCVVMGVGYLRSGFAEVDVYPSRAVLHTSITVLLVGSYLLIIGVLAQVVAETGGTGAFQLQAFLLLIGIVLLAILLLSQRLRQRFRAFVSRHFKRPHYDFRTVWMRLTRATASATDEQSSCSAAAHLIAQTFDVMSTSIWIYDLEKGRLSLCASTARSRDHASDDSVAFAGEAWEKSAERPVFNLDSVTQAWGSALRQVSETQFVQGGARIGVWLAAGERPIGVLILADRVGGVAYTQEEFELLRCIGDQIASNLLNLRLAREIALSKELEAFQTMSAFFVHDLKNTASTLNLMLENLPLHFNDPEFRADALRGIGETTAKINSTIERLSAVGGKFDLQRSEVDLNSVVDRALGDVDGVGGVEFAKNLEPIPKLVGDPEQLRSVVTNLLLNARDAVGGNGRIQVSTTRRDGWATLSVTDDGCGMDPAFVRDSLFRPFKTTKKKGLGIGMFQAKMIVEAHRGRMRVETELGHGTTFQVYLPVQNS